jgi:GTP-binding protein LepA
MTLCLEKRGMLIKQEYISTDRAELAFDLPLAEIVFDFYDKLKSISKGIRLVRLSHDRSSTIKTD